MRILTGLVGIAAAASIAACSTTTTPASPSTGPSSAATTVSASGQPSEAPSPRPSRLEPATGSPALGKYSRTQVDAALDLAARAARESVADPDLLGRAALHNNINDFARITRYLTPSATAYLTLYCRDAYRNQNHRASVAGLALVAYRSGRSTAAATRGTFLHPPPFDQPFTVRQTTISVNPTVGINGVGRMVVTGVATSQVPATKNRVGYMDTLTERFTYYISAVASPASTVGIDGWYGYPAVTWKRR